MVFRALDQKIIGTDSSRPRPRPPPIPQPQQMYHGVSPAATSGGTNGNMVCPCSVSIALHFLPPFFHFPSTKVSLLRLQHLNCRCSSEPMRAGIFQLLHLISYHNRKSRALSPESSLLSPKRASPISWCPGLSWSYRSTGAKFFFLCSVILIDHDNIYRPFSLIDSLIAFPKSSSTSRHHDGN